MELFTPVYDRLNGLVGLVCGVPYHAAWLGRDVVHVALAFAAEANTTAAVDDLEPLGDPVDPSVCPGFTERRTALLDRVATVIADVRSEGRYNIGPLTNLYSSLRYGSHNIAWFMAATVQSIHHPNHLSWVTAKEDVYRTDNKRRSGSITKWMRACNHAAGTEVFTDEQINQIAEQWGAYTYDPSIYSYKAITGSDEVYRAYRDGPESCMQGQSYVRWYGENPDKVQLLKVYRTGKHGPSYIARALLWTTDNGTKVLDRIYPSDGGSHIRYLKDVAKAEGWDSLVTQATEAELESGKRYTVTMNRSESGEYPYVDTFAYVTWLGSDTMECRTHAYTYDCELRCTDGGPETERYYSDRYDRYISPDDDRYRWSDRYNEYLDTEWDEDVQWSQSLQEYILTDDDNIVYSNHHNDYFESDDVVYVESEGDYFKPHLTASCDICAADILIEDCVNLHDDRTICDDHDHVELYDGRYALEDDATELFDGRWALNEETLELEDGRIALAHDCVEIDGEPWLRDEIEPVATPEQFGYTQLTLIGD